MALLMIADDDPVVRHILSSMLKLLGHELIVACSGTEAVSVLNSRLAEGNLPKFLFLDLLLQDMNGLEVLEQIRPGISVETMPAAILSANTEAELEALGPTIRPQFFVEKPFTQDKISSVLAESGIV